MRVVTDTHAPNIPHAGDRLMMERVLLFTDAVFAIVITLLALEIRLPDPTAEPVWTDALLRQALAALVPKLFAFFVSFVVIAIIWKGHLRKYRLLHAFDDATASLLLLQLLFVVLLPFLTSVLAEAPTRTATTLYAADLALAGLAGAAAWWHASGLPGCATALLTPAARRRETALTLAMASVFVLSIVLAQGAPRVAMWSWVLVWPAQALTRRATG
jgi:uncharacterized membrane protein